MKIIHMDSMKETNKRLINLFRNFFLIFLKLKENLIKEKEENVKLKDIFENDILKIEEINPIIPKQSNNYDCGIFILDFVETILKNNNLIKERLILGNHNWIDLFNKEEIYSKREKFIEILKFNFRGKTKIFY